MPQEDCKTKNQPDAEIARQGTARQTVDAEIMAVQAEQEADTAAQDLPVVEGPAKVVAFHGQEVPVYEVNGELYLTGEDLGNMLGLADARNGVRLIFERHKEEVEQHSCAIKLIAQDGQKRTTRLYSQEGCYLISMFARTETAKEVRKWLAALPRKVYQLRAVTPDLAQRIKLEAFREAAQRLAALLATPFGARLGLAKMKRLVRLRASGLITQKEAAKMYDLSVEAVRKIERHLGEILGLQIKPLNQFAREKATQLVCDRLLAAPEAPVKGKLIVLRSTKDTEPLD